MKYDLKPFEKLVDEGYLRKVIKNDLILFNYTDQCTFDRKWNEYTLISRGLILNKWNGEVVASVARKFFNLNEMPETQLINLPKEPYRIFDKIDGSLAIIFFHDNHWQVATRGSFFSPQAIKGQELLKKYNQSKLSPSATYLAEIIYPENKIIVNYGQEEKLVMLAAFDVATCQEINVDAVRATASMAGMEFATEYNYTIEQMIELQKAMSKDQEGFVVRFDSGLRIKIKGDEYMRIARIISHMSPLSFWEAMRDGKVGREYVQQLPEEFRKDFEPMIDKLEVQFVQVLSEIKKDAQSVSHLDLTTKEGKKTLGLLVQGKNDLKHPSAMFPYFDPKNGLALQKYVMAAIRPTGNNFRSLE